MAVNSAAKYNCRYRAIKINCKTKIQEKSNNYQQFRLSKSGQ